MSGEDIKPPPDPERRMSGEVQRDLGRHEALIETLDKSVEDLREEMRKGFQQINDRLDPLVATANQVKGGWKLLAGVGAGASAISAFVTGLLLKLKTGA